MNALRLQRSGFIIINGTLKTWIWVSQSPPWFCLMRVNTQSCSHALQSLHIICITLWLTPTSWRAERLKLVINSTRVCKDFVYSVNFSKLYQISHDSTEMKMNLTKPRWYTSFINTTKTKSCFIVLKEPNDLNSICSKRYELNLLSLFLEKKKNIFLLFILTRGGIP